MKDAEQLNMIVKRRVPFPIVEFEQRTLKFTLSKSHKKDDFGIVLGCKYYIKEITNIKLAEKDPGLKEGDVVLQINGQSLELLNLEEASRLLQKSREKLSLVVQRDVRRSSNCLRWPSQTTVYERLGSVSATPRHSPTPMHYTHSAVLNNFQIDNASLCQNNSKNLPDFSPGLKRLSDSAVTNNFQTNNNNYLSSLPHNYQKDFNFNKNLIELKTNSQQNLFLPDLTNNHLLQQRQLNAVYSQLPKNNNLCQTQSPHTFSISQNQQNQTLQHLNTLQKSATSTSSMMSLSLNADGSFKTYNFANEIKKSNSSQQKLQNHVQHNLNQQNNLHVITLKKNSGNLGIRVIGGNQVGIFVSAVQDDLPAAKNGIKVGDRLHSVNGFSMNGVTREQAVEFLMNLKDEINIQLERSLTEDFLHIKGGQMGDSFYIRTHFSYQKRSSRQELCFHTGDIFHVTDTLAGGSVGYWQVTKVYSANETEIKSNEASGIIPNNKAAEILAKQSQIDFSTIGRSIFRKKLQLQRNKLLKTAEENFLNNVANNTFNEIFDIPLPAYERVVLKKPAFHRPVVLFGPLADVAKNLLLTKYDNQFGTVLINSEQKNLEIISDECAVQISSIDAVMAAQKHCVLLISPGSVERLQLAQYAPIVILIDVDSRNRIRELRTKAGSTTISSKKLIEETSIIKKFYAYLLTATLDASKEDCWFEALRHLIFHLQNRRVWMPEFKPNQSCHNLLLFPIQNCNLESVENNYLTFLNSSKKQCTTDLNNLNVPNTNESSVQMPLKNNYLTFTEKNYNVNFATEDQILKKNNLNSHLKNLVISQPTKLINDFKQNENNIGEDLSQKNLEKSTTNSQFFSNKSVVDNNYFKLMSSSVNPTHNKIMSYNLNKNDNQNINSIQNFCHMKDAILSTAYKEDVVKSKTLNLITTSNNNNNLQQKSVAKLDFNALEDSIATSNFNLQKNVNLLNNV